MKTVLRDLSVKVPSQPHSNQILHCKGEEVSHNIERLNKGEEVFNRCYAGCWFAYSRKLAEVKAYANDVS